MRKLTFERAILVVLIVIMFISTTEIREKYTEKFLAVFSPKNASISTDMQTGKNHGFPTLLLTADRKYALGDYKGAAEEYFPLTLNSALSIDQKSRAIFRLGMCHYYLKDYQKAFESLANAASFDSSNSIIFNNAAVSAYKANDMKSAIEYQLKALKIRPAVEYYYNLARMYEDNEQYDLAAENYLTVAIAEQNLTETDKIDPVRVKEKVARLLPNSQSTDKSTVIVAYKLNSENSNINEVLTVNENEMQIKSLDFIVKVENQKSSKSIVAEYDRKKYDPYNLITEVLWTVYRDGKQVYKKSSDKINLNAIVSGNYEVRLNVKYNGTERMSAKTVRVNNNQSTVGTTSGSNVINTPIKRSNKTYEDAIYEQLFESDFSISSLGYIDKYRVVWGKDNVSTQLIKNEAVDKLSSLYIKNNTKEEAGIWLNLDSLVEKGDLSGKKVNISFYARKITDQSVLDVKARVKMDDMIIMTQKPFDLDFKWKEYNMYISIPRGASGLTFSIKTRPGEEFKIDKFIITD